MSIKRIAQMAGVSIATVSRVLNNPDYRCSSEEVRERMRRQGKLITRRIFRQEI